MAYTPCAKLEKPLMNQTSPSSSNSIISNSPRVTLLSNIERPLSHYCIETKFISASNAYLTIDCLEYSSIPILIPLLDIILNRIYDPKVIQT